jgi:glycine betaine transporter
VVATAFGVAASLGMGALQINSGLNAVFGLAVDQTAQVAIIVLTAAVFLTSAVSGVERGIKYLSSFNMVVAALLALAVFLLGPTVVIIDTLTNTLGSYLTDFIRMSLRATPFRDSTWVGNWTIFYWAWWISWSPFVGLFIARVSRGRTLREFILGTMLAPSLAPSCGSRSSAAPRSTWRSGATSRCRKRCGPTSPAPCSPCSRPCRSAC